MIRKLLISLSLLLLSCPFYGQTTGYHRFGQIFSRVKGGVAAQVVPSAQISVTESLTGVPATIYRDINLSLPINPPLVTADVNGQYDYYIPLNYCVNESISSPSQGIQNISNICQSTFTPTIGGANPQIQYNNNGVLAGSLATTTAGGDVTTPGAIAAASLSTAGAVSAGTVGATGAVSAGSLSTAGAVAAGSASVTGVLSAGTVNTIINPVLTNNVDPTCAIDSTTQMNTALATPSEGTQKTVLFPPGCYLYSDQLTVGSGVSLQGAGIGLTEFRAVPTVNSSNVSGLTINGGGTGGTLTLSNLTHLVNGSVITTTGLGITGCAGGTFSSSTKLTISTANPLANPLAFNFPAAFSGCALTGSATGTATGVAPLMDIHLTGTNSAIKDIHVVNTGLSTNAISTWTLVTPGNATSTSIAITSNVATITAANSFVATEPLYISGCTTATYLNGKLVYTIATGLSGTQYEFNFTHADVGSTPDATCVAQAAPMLTINVPSTNLSYLTAQLATTGYFALTVRGITHMVCSKGSPNGEVRLDPNTVTIGASSITFPMPPSTCTAASNVSESGANAYWNQVRVSLFQASAIYADASGFSIQGVQVTGSPNMGILMHGAASGKVIGNTVEMTSSDGIHMDGHTTGISVVGNTVLSTGDDSFAILSSTSDTCGGAGDCRTANISIVGNTIDQTSGRAVAIDGAKNITVVGNTAHVNIFDCFFIHGGATASTQLTVGTDGVLLEGNSADMCGGNGVTVGSANVTYPTNNVSVIGNVIRQIHNGGLAASNAIIGSVTNLKVDSNQFFGFTYGLPGINSQIGIFLNGVAGATFHSNTLQGFQQNALSAVAAGCGGAGCNSQELRVDGLENLGNNLLAGSRYALELTTSGFTDLTLSNIHTVSSANPFAGVADFGGGDAAAKVWVQNFSGDVVNWNRGGATARMIHLSTGVGDVTWDSSGIMNACGNLCASLNLGSASNTTTVLGTLNAAGDTIFIKKGVATGVANFSSNTASYSSSLWISGAPVVCKLTWQNVAAASPGVTSTLTFSSSCPGGTVNIDASTAANFFLPALTKIGAVFVSPPLRAALTTTAAATDNLTVTGMTASGFCSLTPTNASAATNIATTYVSNKTNNQITVAHAVTASMTYDVICTAN